MSFVFREGMSRQATKSKQRTRRKIRHPKGIRKLVRRFLGKGPSQGLSLTYDREDPHFARRWVLSFGDLILAVDRKPLLGVWNKLTESHRDQYRDSFEPIPLEVQDRRRRLDDEEFRRIAFWDKVTRLGRKKHSKGPLTGVTVYPSQRERKPQCESKPKE